MPAATSAILVAVAVAVILSLRRVMAWLCGPVLFYELIRAARRGRTFVVRTLLGLLLLVFLFIIYRTNSEQSGRSFVNRDGQLHILFHGRWIKNPDPGTLAEFRSIESTRFAEACCIMFMCVQFVAVLLLTPAFTAGSIAEEKERNRLEFLLATHLSNREIVLGKLAGSVAHLGLLLLVGLPILSLMQLLGGIQPRLMLASLAATGFVTLSLAALSILNSVYARKPRDAILLTYLEVIAYLVVSLLGLVPLTALRRAASLPLWLEEVAALVAGLIDVFNAGNPLIVLLDLREEWRKGADLEVALFVLLRSFAVFHVLVAIVLTTWAVLRVRAAAWGRVQTSRNPAQVSTWKRWRLFRPALGTNPMLWKEIFAERPMTLHGAGKIVVGLIVVVSFAPALWIVGAAALQVYLQPAARGAISATLQFIRQLDGINTWVRLAGTGVATLTFVGAAVRAASSISGERERHTIDSLLATPLAPREILFAKWLGSFLCVRGAWLWLLAIWTLGVLTDGLHVATLPWLVLSLAVYTAFFSMLGLWFSLLCSGTLRATLVTLTVMAVLSLGHWLPWFFLERPRQAELPLTIQFFGLTPPVALGWFAFRGDAISFNPLAPLNGSRGFTDFDWEQPMDAFLGILIGLGIWCALAWVLWKLSLRRLDRMCHVRS